MGLLVKTRIILCLAVLVCGLQLNSNSALASIYPTLKVECGFLEQLSDEDGEFIRFHPIADVLYTGKKLSYWVHYTNKRNTPLKDQSRLQGYQTRSTSSSFTGLTSIEWEKDFHNSMFESRYYLSKYLEFTIIVKDSTGKSATSKCIYKERF
jgi:hypothetical protein